MMMETVSENQEYLEHSHCGQSNPIHFIWISICSGNLSWTIPGFDTLIRHRLECPLLLVDYNIPLSWVYVHEEKVLERVDKHLFSWNTGFRYSIIFRYNIGQGFCCKCPPTCYIQKTQLRQSFFVILQSPRYLQKQKTIFLELGSLSTIRHPTVSILKSWNFDTEISILLPRSIE